MFSRCFLTFIVLFAFAAPFSTGAQTTDQALQIGAKEVLLDVIVRDKKGRNVRDLNPADIEVYEDGVKQTINSFRLIETTATANPTGLPVDPARPVNLVTLVFDNLDNSSRKLAREAALDFVNTGMHQNVLVSVYTIGQRFYVLQSFTNDKENVRQAIELATKRAETQYADVSRKIAEQLEIIANAADFGPGAGAPAQAQAAALSTANPTAPTMPSGLAPTGAGLGGTGLDKAVAQITLNTLRAIETEMAEQQARASIYTFLHVAREQKRLLGRKTLLYFSPGIIVPPNLVDVLRTTLSEANRANVSIYAIDARGLQSDSESDRMRLQLAQAISARNNAFNEGGALADVAGSFKAAELAESSLRQNKQGTLAELAEGTGGALIANTNDLRKPIRQIAEDLAAYYALSYAPTAQELDGKFRKLTLKLARADVKVISRSGYFAVPAVDGKAVMGYEMPLLMAASEVTPKRDFAYQMGVLRFAPGAPGGNHGAQHLLLLAVPLSELTFKTDPVKKLYSTHFSVLALIKNAQGEVVTRVSQDFPLQGKLERLESLQKGNFDFTKPFTLAPGNYQVQTVVYDFESGKTSVQSRTLLVPAPLPNLAVSSLTLIKRFASAGLAKPSEDKPLLTTNGRIVPNLGETVNVATEKSLGFYLVAYTKATDKATLLLEFSQNGAVFAKTTMDLPAPDAQGRLAHLFSVPAESLASGAYQVRAIVQQGEAQAADVAAFTLLNPNPVPKEVATVTTTAALPPAAPPVAVAPPPPISPLGLSAAVLSVTRATPAPANIRAAAVNLPDLLAEVERNGATLHQTLLAFTYRLRKVRHVLDEAGQPTKEEFQDFEAYPVRGRHVLIKLAEDGKKLPDWEVENDRKRAGEDLERAEQGDSKAAIPGYVTAAIKGDYRGKAASLLIDPTAFLQACDFTDPRYEMLGEREMIVLDFLPRLGAKLPLTTAFVANLTGTVWIDAVDKMLVRLEAKNILPGLGKDKQPLPISAEPKLVYQQTRLATGEWFPAVIRMNADGDASALYGLNWDVVFEFTDYRKFITAGEKEKLLTPPEKNP